MSGNGRIAGAGRKRGDGSPAAVLAWAKRGRANGVDWRLVSPAVLGAALSVAVAENVNLTFKQAMGGRGVVVEPYQHPVRYEVQYAGTAEELVEVLLQFIEAFASPAEDVFQAWGITR